MSCSKNTEQLLFNISKQYLKVRYEIPENDLRILFVNNGYFIDYPKDK